MEIVHTKMCSKQLSPASWAGHDYPRSVVAAVGYPLRPPHMLSTPHGAPHHKCGECGAVQAVQLAEWRRKEGWRHAMTQWLRPWRLCTPRCAQSSSLRHPGQAMTTLVAVIKRLGVNILYYFSMIEVMINVFVHTSVISNIASHVDHFIGLKKIVRYISSVLTRCVFPDFSPDLVKYV